MLSLSHQCLSVLLLLFLIRALFTIHITTKHVSYYMNITTCNVNLNTSLNIILTVMMIMIINLIHVAQLNTSDTLPALYTVM